MHDVLRARVMRKIESLPEEQVYAVLDYIDFLESKYASAEKKKRAGGLQRLAEGIEDGLRRRAFNPSNLREAFQVIAAADRVLSGVTEAGRQILGELSRTGRGEGGTDADADDVDDDAHDDSTAGSGSGAGPAPPVAGRVPPER